MRHEIPLQQWTDMINQLTLADLARLYAAISTMFPTEATDTSETLLDGTPDDEALEEEPYLRNLHVWPGTKRYCAGD